MNANKWGISCWNWKQKRAQQMNSSQLTYLKHIINLCPTACTCDDE